MKRRLFTFALAALTIGLLGSCSKINERIDGLDNRVGNIENEKIASIENQIAAINASIADLGTIRKDILDLQVAVGAKGEDIAELKAADEALGKRIDELQTYVDTKLAKYATTEWANATFATLEQLKTTNTELGALKETVGNLGETFDGKLADLKTELTNAINTAVSNLETRISTLEARVSALEQMIQSVNITPAYSDGSVEAVDGILTLKCIVSPAEALTGMQSLKDSLLIYADSVKVKTKGASAYVKIEVSEASVLDAAQGAITLTADISKCLPKGEGKVLTVAVNIKNGISDFTTEFVPVTVAAAKPIVEYVEIGGVKWATKNLGAEKVTDSGDYFAWGATELAYSSLSSNTFTFVASRPASYGGSGWTQSSGFNEVNTPYYDGSAYTKYTESDSKTVLESGDDAATALLGSGWRMPTSAEFKDLYDACLNGSYDKTTNPSGASASVGKGVYWCTSYDGVAGCLFCDGTNKLFFPAADYGDGTSLSNAGNGYWSSSLSTIDTDWAYFFFFNSGFVNPQNLYGRYYGFSVRPVKAAAAPLPVGALKGEFSVSATKKVRFSQGNLVATIDATGAPTAWKFSAHQYEYIGANVANTKIGKEAGDVDFFGWSTDAASNNWGIHTKTSATNRFTTGNFKDWGKAVGDGDTWRTLSKNEWAYLINTNGEENIRKGKYKYGVTVCEKASCLILAPDDFEGTIAESYDAAAWASAEAAGLVCLPAAGDRIGSGVGSYGTYGFYWSSSKSGDEEEAYDLRFTGSDVNPGGRREKRYIGCSVRLVTDVK